MAAHEANQGAQAGAHSKATSPEKQTSNRRCSASARESTPHCSFKASKRARCDRLMSQLILTRAWPKNGRLCMTSCNPLAQQCCAQAGLSTQQPQGESRAAEAENRNLSWWLTARPGTIHSVAASTCGVHGGAKPGGTPGFFLAQAWTPERPTRSNKSALAGFKPTTSTTEPAPRKRRMT